MGNYSSMNKSLYSLIIVWNWCICYLPVGKTNLNTSDNVNSYLICHLLGLTPTWFFTATLYFKFCPLKAQALVRQLSAISIKASQHPLQHKLVPKLLAIRYRYWSGRETLSSENTHHSLLQQHHSKDQYFQCALGAPSQIYHQKEELFEMRTIQYLIATNVLQKKPKNGD